MGSPVLFLIVHLLIIVVGLIMDWYVKLVKCGLILNGL
jgi:hypothetical protein